MPHSPHSSLSTPTPAILSSVPAPVTPPRAPPTSLGSRDPRCSSSVSVSSDDAIEIPVASLPASISTGSSSYASSPDSDSLCSASSSASSISFVLSAPSTWPKHDTPTPTPFRLASSARPSPSPVPMQLQAHLVQSTNGAPAGHSRDASPPCSPSRRAVKEQSSPTASVDLVASADESLRTLSIENTGRPTLKQPATLKTSIFPPATPSPKNGVLSMADLSSPKLPPAPAQQIIPLPEVDLDPRAQPFVSSHLSSCGFSGSAPNELGLQIEGASPGMAFLGCQHHDDADTSTTSQASLHGTEKDGKNYKTPNVYINGLPPHFPEDQLYALTAHFGEVRSVRTFTRHVRDSESGYGFVLFETVEAAERCITSLRRYRNLHPTFSKQIHKIPGTPYSQMDQDSTFTSDEWDVETHQSGEASFKARLESLHDPTSTNLYIEGLPLSIDEPTLSALVSPHRINSSRFFQTRLSNPPRIIAFVRLETRVGAEEIIERLHGRMVRGWNDPGSRISVRFADTTEQRELRRAERMNREGDQSPARLTLAQASLLNLRGQDMRPKVPPYHSYPVIGRENHPQLDFRYCGALNDSRHDVDFAVDYSRAPMHQPVSTTINSPSHLGVHFSPYNDAITLPPPTVDPAMTALLTTLRNNGSPFRGKGMTTGGEGSFYANNGTSNHAYGRNYVETIQRNSQPQNKYADEFILRGHSDVNVPRYRSTIVESNNRRKANENIGTNISIGLRGHRTQASTIHLPHTQQGLQSSSSAPITITEAEFHASGSNHSTLNRAQAVIDDTIHKGNGQKGCRNSLPTSQASAHSQRELVSSKPSLPIQSHATSQLVHNTFQQSHMRSTTLPPRSSFNQHQHQRHVQHNSMSIPTTNSNRSNQQRNGTNKFGLNNDQINIYEDGSHGRINRTTESNYDPKLTLEGNPNTGNYTFRAGPGYEIAQSPPSLVSPALTYTSQSSTSLSPATPFFDSFTNHGEVFERAVVEGKKLRAGGQ